MLRPIRDQTKKNHQGGCNATGVMHTETHRCPRTRGLGPRPNIEDYERPGYISNVDILIESADMLQVTYSDLQLTAKPFHIIYIQHITHRNANSSSMT